jgi:hypothetical protein
MTPNEFRSLVYTSFMAVWDVGPVSIYTFDNEKFTPPDPADPTVANEGICWVRLVVRHGDSQQKTLGPVGRRKFENSARVILQIFTVPNTGMKDSDALNQAFKEVFDTDLGRGDVFGGQSTYRERGTAEGWQMSEATVSFTYDEIR